mmetsp:Transcript_34018/g.58428  ORF Transcript_34018/g.58428 Transcript_34018/m.58428 type:complete len:241 (-) Transcript_34018:41-763(-)
MIEILFVVPYTSNDRQPAHRPPALRFAKGLGHEILLFHRDRLLAALFGLATMFAAFLESDLLILDIALQEPLRVRPSTARGPAQLLELFRAHQCIDRGEVGCARDLGRLLGGCARDRLALILILVVPGLDGSRARRLSEQEVRRLQVYVHVDRVPGLRHVAEVVRLKISVDGFVLATRQLRHHAFRTCAHVRHPSLRGLGFRQDAAEDHASILCQELKLRECTEQRGLVDALKDLDVSVL